MRTIEGLKALPGTRAVGGTSFLPLAGMGPATSFWRADQPQPAPNDRPVADARPVTAGYFTAMGIPVARRPRRQRERHGRSPARGGDQRVVRAADLPWRQSDRPAIHPQSRQRAAARDHRRGRRREAGQPRRRDSADGVSVLAPVCIRHHDLRGANRQRSVHHRDGGSARDSRDRSAAAGVGGASTRRGVRRIHRAGAADRVGDEHLCRGGAAAGGAWGLRHRRLFSGAALARVRYSRRARRQAGADHQHGRRTEPPHRRDWIDPRHGWRRFPPRGCCAGCCFKSSPTIQARSSPSA